MLASALVVACVLLAGTTTGVPVETMRLHAEPETMQLHKANISQVTLKHFSFNDCGASNDPGHVSQLSISPDPVKLPGNITVAAAASLSTTVKAPIKADVKVEKKVGVWIKIPCVDDIGSCTYDDLCQVLAKLVPLTPKGKCPDPLPSLGIPCRCPLTSFNFKLPPTTFTAPSLPPSVPGWLSNGDYKISVKAQSNGGQELLCFDLEISLDTK